LENKGKSEEKERRVPKRTADFSIFKMKMNPNFLKNAPKKEGKNNNMHQFNFCCLFSVGDFQKKVFHLI